MKIQNRRSGLFVSMAVLTTLAGCAQGTSTDNRPSAQKKGGSPETTTAPTPAPTYEPSHSRRNPHPIYHPGSTPSPTPPPGPTPPVACDSAALKEFSGYGIYASGTATVQGMNISHGIAASTITIDGADIGYGLSRDFGRYDVVGDQVDLSFVEVETGGLAYGSKVRFHEGANVAGVTKKVAPFDRSSLAAKLASIQTKLLGLPAIPAVVDCPPGDDCTTTLTGTIPTVNRFTLRANSIKKKSKIVINVPKHATAVVVIDEPNPHLKDLQISAPAETVWILAQPGKLTLDFMTLTGTVLAPTSTIELDQALVMGRTLTKDFVTPACNDDSACSTVDSQEMPEKVCL